MNRGLIKGNGLLRRNSLLRGNGLISRKNLITGKRKEQAEAALILWIGVYGLAVLLKLHLPAALLLAAGLTAMLHLHMKRREQALLMQQRFQETVFYMDTMLYSFQKEQKILNALENTLQVMDGCSMSRTLGNALSYMQLTFDETEVMKRALEMIEEDYPCRRLHGMHQFMLHAEYYGGEIETPISILLQDKNDWQCRIYSTMKDRREMFRQVLFSVAASILICCMILYLPALNIDISSSRITQGITVMVLLLDDGILYLAQKYLTADWLNLDNLPKDSNQLRTLQDWKAYDEKKEKTKSMIAAAVVCAVGLLLIAFGKSLAAAGILGMGVFIRYQHRIGQNLRTRRLSGGIQAAFPQWLLDLALLLQSENVQVALEKSQSGAPEILKEDISNLLKKIELQPEQSGPYRDFLKDFRIPEIQSTMGMLFAMTIGSSGGYQHQMKELIGKNLKMLDRADKLRLKDQSSGMYLLFLAPLLTASLKLAGDMTVFLLLFVKDTEWLFYNL